MARQSRNPYGYVKDGYLWDTRLGEFIRKRTSEIVSPADALKIPKGVRTRHRTGAVSIRYKPPKGKRFHSEQFIDIVRRQIQRAPLDARVIIRGQGGTAEYDEEWWASTPTDIEELLSYDDDELADFLYNLDPEEGPKELDLYIGPNE